MNAYDYKNRVWRTLRSNRYAALFVETIHTGFVEGKEFRSFFDFSLSTGEVKVIKFVSPVPFIIHFQSFNVVEGELEFKSIAGATEAGTFNQAVPIFGKNRSAERPEPYYEGQITLNSGGTITGGVNSETVRLKTSGVSAHASTVGTDVTDVRFLPAGTYYLQFTATGTTRGVYTLSWEERPA